MSGSVVRSVSFPAADLADVQDLAAEHGGISQLFQFCYKTILAHRSAHESDPSRAELAVLLHEKDASDAAQAEALARMRRRRAEERAAAAREREAVAEAARAKIEASAPRIVKPKRRYEAEVVEGRELLAVQVTPREVEHATARLRRLAEDEGWDAERFVADCRAVQTNLLALPGSKEGA